MGQSGSSLRPGRGVHLSAATRHLVLVELDNLHRYLGNFVGLITVDHSEIAGAGQVHPAATAALGEPILEIIGDCQSRPDVILGAPGCLPRDRFAPPAAALGRRWHPAWVIVFRRRDREFPELRESRCSNRASLPTSASLASINSTSRPAIAMICPA